MKEGYLELAASGGGRRIDLAGEQMTLGRSPDNDVAFPGDNAVSRLHAVVKPYGEDWSLLDVGSVNGTYVNGERMHGQHTLQEGDVITLGAQRLVFHGPATSSPYDISSCQQAQGCQPRPATWMGGRSGAVVQRLHSRVPNR